MQTQPITPDTLAASVISVPPLARTADGAINHAENQKIARHLEAGGVTTLLYGGNAVLYHVGVREYGSLLSMLAEIGADTTLMIPSVGPGYGTMMDQAAILKDFPFPTAMILPTRDVVTPQGVATAVRRFVEATGRPAVLYIKNDGYVDVPTVRQLMEDDLLSFIKYAVVRPDTSDDVFLRSLVDEVGPTRIVSGIGEQPALPHLRDFGLAGFTSGCVCIAPSLSMQMLKALKRGDFAAADQIRETFCPLEDLRNEINPIRVLHAAVAEAGIADTGPIIPLLCDVADGDRSRIATAAKSLLKAERAATV